MALTKTQLEEVESVTLTSRINMTQVGNLDEAIKLDCYTMDTAGYRLAATLVVGNDLVLIYQRH